jgi:hypothetical protein
MGEGFLGVVGNHQPLERLKLKNGIVDLIARRRVDGAKLSYFGIRQLEDLLGLLIPRKRFA